MILYTAKRYKRDLEFFLKKSMVRLAYLPYNVTRKLIVFIGKLPGIRLSCIVQHMVEYRF